MHYKRTSRMPKGWGWWGITLEKMAGDIESEYDLRCIDGIKEECDRICESICIEMPPDCPQVCFEECMDDRLVLCLKKSKIDIPEYLRGIMDG